LHSTAEDSDAFGKGFDSLLEREREESRSLPSLTAKTSTLQAILALQANFGSTAATEELMA
jgi:hypothetical protein